MLHDTRVSIRLTPGSHATQHPGVRYAETRVSYNLSLHRKKKKPAKASSVSGLIVVHGAHGL